MLDTDRYRRWVSMLAASDRVLEQLFWIAAAAVLVWEVARRLPEPWRGRARLVYGALGLGVLLTTTAGEVTTGALVLAAAVFGVVAVVTNAVVQGAGAVGGRALGVFMKGRRAAPTSQGKE